MVSLADMQLPPHDSQAEMWLLCCILLDPDVYYEISEIGINPLDFYEEENVLVYAAMKKLMTKGSKLDIITLADTLTRAKKFDEMWGNDYLYELSTVVLTTAPAKEYAKIIKRDSRLRMLIRVCKEAIAKCYDMGDVTEIIPAFREILSEDVIDSPTTDFADSYLEFYDQMGEVDERICVTGLDWVDRFIGGLYKWNLIILGARPSVGKTMMMINMMIHAAEQSKRVLCISLEMTWRAMTKRIVSHQTGMSKAELEDKTKKETMAERINNITFQAELIKITERSMTLDDILLTIEKEHIMNWLDVVFIDYLQIISIGRGSNKNDVYGEMTRELRQIAKRLGIAIVILSQLNRKADWVNDAPKLSHLRDSGAIESDADVVLLLHRKFWEWTQDLQVIIAKNREGEAWSTLNYECSLRAGQIIPDKYEVW